MSSQLITKFVLHLETQGRSPSTLIAYKKDLEQLHQHLNTDLLKLGSEEVRAALTHLTEVEKFTPKTVSRKINSYRTFFRFAVESGLLQQNPALEVSHPRFKPKQPRVLSTQECAALRSSVSDNERLAVMVEVMLQAGLRISEVSRLKVSDLDLSNAYPVMNISAYATNPARQVPVNAKLLETLKVFLRENSNPDAPLFATREGKHMIIRNIRSSIDRSLQKVGIEDTCVNDLRNTFIVQQLRAGLPLKYLAQVVGHTSSNTTAKYLDLLGAEYTPKPDVTLVEV